MFGLILSLAVSALTWGPRVLLGAWRRRRLGRRGVVELHLEPQSAGPRSIAAIVEALGKLAADPTPRALLVRVWLPGLGLASAQALHQALRGVRESGKLVLVQLDAAGTAALAAMSAADRVLVSPGADLMLEGVGAELTFFGDALRRVGLRVEMVAAGAYKSFGEPYTRGFASRPNREALGTLVSDLHDQLRAMLASARGVTPEAVDALIARSPVSAAEVVEARLADGVAFPDQAESALEKLLDQELHRVSLGSYLRWRRLERWLDRLGQRRRRLVVVHLEGPVVHNLEASGGSGRRIDAERVVPTLDALREDDSVAAVVLAIDSPGGSALASDLIARAVSRLTATRPVVACLGGVAASGGYYIAAPTAEIVAWQGTVTGSIGVVGGKVVIGEAAGRFGAHAERVEALPDGGMLSGWTAFSPEQRARFKASLSRTYERFLAVVAGGRRRPREAMAEVAEGRVWTGRQALARGLVDHLGGLDLALERARMLAGVAPGQGVVRHLDFPAPRMAMLSLLLGRGQAARPDPIDAALRGLGPAGERLALLRAHPVAALALLPWVIDGEAPATIE